VRTRNIVAVGAVTSALLLAGCAGGATIKTTIGPGSPFCNDLATFAPEAATLSDAAAQSRATLLQALPPIQALLTKLANEAPTGDTVNGKPVKADVGVVARVYGDLITDLQNASPTDPAAVKKAVAAVDAKEGQALTDAVGRLDAYTSPVCKVSPAATATTSSSVPSTASTVAPVGPAAPTTIAPVGPAAPTTTAPATTTTS
jgi:hypothetical protein